MFSIGKQGIIGLPLAKRAGHPGKDGKYEEVKKLKASKLYVVFQCLSYISGTSIDLFLFKNLLHPDEH